jgi:excisionase family DNA binding protein
MSPDPPLSQLISARAAAEVLGIPYTTLRHWITLGKLPVVKLGRFWYLERKELTKLVERGKQPRATARGRR